MSEIEDAELENQLLALTTTPEERTGLRRMMIQLAMAGVSEDELVPMVIHWRHVGLPNGCVPARTETVVPACEDPRTQRMGEILTRHGIPLNYVSEDWELRFYGGSGAGFTAKLVDRLTADELDYVIHGTETR